MNNNNYQQSLSKAMELLDDIKHKISNQEYLEMCNTLKDLHKHKSDDRNLYKITYEFAGVEFRPIACPCDDEDCDDDLFEQEVVIHKRKQLAYLNQSLAGMINISRNLKFKPDMLMSGNVIEFQPEEVIFHIQSHNGGSFVAKNAITLLDAELIN